VQADRSWQQTLALMAGQMASDRCLHSCRRQRSGFWWLSDPEMGDNVENLTKYARAETPTVTEQNVAVALRLHSAGLCFGLLTS